jgi:DNA-directed RNA polymerase subunit omega
MLRPSIDSLLEKIDSKYTLVVLEGKRAHELREMSSEEREKIDYKFESVKPTLQALEEIAAGRISIHPDPSYKYATLAEKQELLHLYKLEEEKKIKELIAREQEEEDAKAHGGHVEDDGTIVYADEASDVDDD